MKEINEVVLKMMDINYGYLYEGEDISESEDLPKYYTLNSPEKTIKDKMGMCWDQVELERMYFSKLNVETKSYFMCNYDEKFFPTHTFLVLFMNDKYYYFENAWMSYMGVEEFNSLNDLLREISSRFSRKCFINHDLKEDNIVVYEYTKPEYNITGKSFFEHCENGVRIDFR